MDDTGNEGPWLEIPSDIYFLLFALLDFRGIAALGSTCKVAHTVMKSLEKLAFEHVRLSPMQAEIRNRVKLMPDAEKGHRNVFVVRAPMGFGKTITGLAIAFAFPDDKHRYVFIVPPKAYDTWVREAGKVFGVASNAVTKDTRVLFAHSAVATHKRHIDKILEKTPDGPLKFGAKVRAIIITTASSFGAKVANRWGTRVVLDEAHSTTDRAWGQLARFRWVALLSANVIAPRTGDTTTCRWGEIAISGRYMAGTIPLVVMHRSLVEPYVTRDFDETRNYTPPAYKIDSIAKNLNPYLNALTFIFAELPRGQVAVYLPDGDTGDAIADEMHNVAHGWDIIPFVNATTKIRQFEALDRAVLLIRLNKSEAINILASHLVIVRPDWVNPIRYAQLIGRVLRPTSRHKQASVYLVVPRGVPALRASYYDALRRLMADDLQLPVPEHRSSELEKADASLRLCGSALDRAAPTEVVAALGVGFDAPHFVAHVLRHWRAEAAPTIALRQMQALLGLPVDPPGNTDVADAAEGGVTRSGAPVIASVGELEDLLGLA